MMSHVFRGKIYAIDTGGQLLSRLILKHLVEAALSQSHSVHQPSCEEAATAISVI